MAVIKVTKGGKSLANALNYIEKKTNIVSGFNCSDERKQALQDMKNTKELYEKKDGRQYKSYVQSFSPKEVTAKQAHKIGQEWAGKNFAGFEVYIATHTDKDHIHNHFIVNSVSWENGKKLHEGKKELLNQKQSNDVICKKYGLSIPEKKLDGEFRSFNQNKYQFIKKALDNKNVKSYIISIGGAILNTMELAQNKENFISLMQGKGYSVDWKDNHKHVTFKDIDGNKVRLLNLQKTFNSNEFSKEELEKQFTKNMGGFKHNQNIHLDLQSTGKELVSYKIDRDMYEIMQPYIKYPMSSFITKDNIDKVDVTFSISDKVEFDKIFEQAKEIKHNQTKYLELKSTGEELSYKKIDKNFYRNRQRFVDFKMAVLEDKKDKEKVILVFSKANDIKYEKTFGDYKNITHSQRR